MLHTLHWSLIQALRRKHQEEDKEVSPSPKFKRDAIRLTEEEVEKGKNEEKYKLVIRSVLLDSKLSAPERDFANAMKLKYDIDDSFHEECLRACGWSLGEWKVGRK